MTKTAFKKMMVSLNPNFIAYRNKGYNGGIKIFGTGTQTRSFLYIDECVEGVIRLMNSDFIGPVNIGSDEMVSINQLVDIVSTFENKNLHKNYIDGPLGVAGRNSDNNLIFEKLNWKPNKPLSEGLQKTYHWIKTQLEIQ